MLLKKEGQSPVRKLFPHSPGISIFFFQEEILGIIPI